KAIEVIKWFNAHSIALGKLNLEQSMTGEERVLALILLVITCWTAHYCSLCHLLGIQDSVKTSWIKHKSVLISCVGAKAKAKAKALEIQLLVEDQCFWKDVEMYVLAL
ncbi:hypothetical protein BDQ17DRAFT_1259820, partial [Cyathus striatus]